LHLPGVILLGVRDNGTVGGGHLTNDLKAKIISLARNCSPAIQIHIIQVETVIAVEVPMGEDKPYSCSSGYYRRLDGATQKLTSQELRIMFQENAPIPYEEKTVSDMGWSDISRDKLKAFLKESNICIRRIVPQDLLASLNLVRKDILTNGAALFFAKDIRKFILQSQMTLIAFKGKTRVHIYDRRDVQDDLLTQFNEAILFLQKHLNRRSIIRGVNREDSSMRRNERIADIFFRMDKGERAGTGIQRMREALTAAGLEVPEIIHESFFSIIFMRPLAESGAESYDISAMGNDAQKILKVLAKGEASAIEIVQSMQKKSVTGSLKRLLRELIVQGKIEHTIPNKPNSRLQKYCIAQGSSHVK
jgi:ATP-dependent DNA helicase RecG